jgi:flagellin-specific chaperone FliS
MARRSWLDESGETTLIDDYAQQTGSFINAMADGKIEESELAAHEARLVALMKKIEPKLDDEQHAELTELLCELSAYNVMQMVHMLHEARPVTQFKG